MNVTHVVFTNQQLYSPPLSPHPPPASARSQLVYAQVAAENIPLGPLGTLMPLLQMAGVLNDPNMKTVLKSTRECQENLVVLDRTHSIKVRAGEGGREEGGSQG